MVRLTCDQRTQDYAVRRRSEGKSDRQIIRCLRRYIAREVYQLITDPPAVPDEASLRAARPAAGIGLATATAQLSTWPTRIFELERRLSHDADLADSTQPGAGEEAEQGPSRSWLARWRGWPWRVIASSRSEPACPVSVSIAVWTSARR
jgi:hypothetical protein